MDDGALHHIISKVHHILWLTIHPSTPMTGIRYQSANIELFGGHFQGLCAIGINQAWNGKVLSSDAYSRNAIFARAHLFSMRMAFLSKGFDLNAFMHTKCKREGDALPKEGTNDTE